jgi:repressor of nif and glnA expression
MYCPKCGNAAVEDALYCHSCGGKLPKVTREEFSLSSDDLAEKIKQLVHEGNVTRIIVKGEKGETLVDIPVTVGVVGIVLAPVLAAVGVIAALVTRCTVVVERKATS